VVVLDIKDVELLHEIDKALKAMKDAEDNLEKIEKDNYLKTKIAKLKYDFAREEYIRLLQLAREYKIKYNMQELVEKIIDA